MARGDCHSSCDSFSPQPLFSFLIFWFALLPQLVDDGAAQAGELLYVPTQVQWQLYFLKNCCRLAKLKKNGERAHRREREKKRAEAAARCADARCFVSSINIISLLVHHSQDKTNLREL
jgi:hypothetical protein